MNKNKITFFSSSIDKAFQKVAGFYKNLKKPKKKKRNKKIK